MRVLALDLGSKRIGVAVSDLTSALLYVGGLIGHVFIFALIYLAVLIKVQFDYWEIRPNELLHHHGILSDLERYPAPNLRVSKEVSDVFEYFLFRSGRLILHPSSETRAIILDNVPFIDYKEKKLTSMLGALQVQVRQAQPEE